MPRAIGDTPLVPPSGFTVIARARLRASWTWLFAAVVSLMIGGCDGSSNLLAPRGSLPPVEPPVVQSPAVQLPPAGSPGGQPLPTVEPLPPVSSAGPLPPLEPLPSLPLTPSQPSAMMLFDPWQVSDPMAENRVALTFLAPSGWQAEGFVEWQPQWSRLAQLHTRVVDPGTGLTVHWLPIQDFIWFQPPAGLEVPLGGNYQGKAFVPPITDPAEFVNAFWLPGPLAHLAGATLVRVDPLQPVADELVRQFGGPAQAAAYRMRYAYTVDGQPWEEDVTFALLYSSPNTGVTSWYVNFATTARAPQGELDRNAGLVSTIIAGRITTPEWEAIYRLTQALFTQGIQQQMADTVAFGNLLAQYRAESQALQQQVTAERQASQDRIADLRGEILLGVQSFVNPNDGSIVQLPTSWNQYYVNAQGQYVVTNQPGFDPNSMGGGWRQLTPR